MASSDISASERVAQLSISRGETEKKVSRRKRVGALLRAKNFLRASSLAPYLRARPAAVLPHRDGGFTLLEIVVALAILGLSLTVLFGIFSQNVARTHWNETRAEERALANSLLLHAESTSAPTDSAGKTASGLAWRVSVAPYGSGDDEKNWPEAVSEITVTVARGDDRPASVTLRTLKLMPKAPAP